MCVGYLTVDLSLFFDFRCVSNESWLNSIYFVQYDSFFLFKIQQFVTFLWLRSYILVLILHHSLTLCIASVVVAYSLSHVWILCDPMDCSRLLCPRDSPYQKNWSELPFPSPGDLPDPGIKCPSPTQANGFFNTEPSGKPLCPYHVTDFCFISHLNMR